MTPRLNPPRLDRCSELFGGGGGKSLVWTPPTLRWRFSAFKADAELKLVYLLLFGLFAPL